MSSVISIIVVALVLSAFFSGMEIAFTSSNKLKLEIDRKQNRLFGYIANIFVNKPGEYLTTILVGNNIALVIFSLQMTTLMHILAAKWGINMSDSSIIIETLISSIIIIFAAEFTPKAIVRHNPNSYLRIFIFPIYLFYIVLYPITKVTSWLSMALLRLAGLPVKKEHINRGFNKVDLEHFIEEGTEAEKQQDNEIKIFQNALDFSDLKVRDCMIPRVDIEAVEDDTSIEELSKRFIDSNYSRIFVWHQTIDNIVGYVNIKSLFNSPANIGEILIPVSYIPETLSAQRLLSKFIKTHKSVAVVIDEFGGTAGIISLEDVLEEIFGEIEDEHDSQDMIEKQVGEREWLLSCRLEIDYLNEKYHLGIEESEEYDTLAGYIIFHEEVIPSAGKTINIDNKQIKIIKSSSSRIDLAKVKLI